MSEFRLAYKASSFSVRLVFVLLVKLKLVDITATVSWLFAALGLINYKKIKEVI
jgi:hypothetical protein